MGEGVVASPESHHVTGRRFGRYQLLLELGRGGMATIYLARLVGPENFQKLVVIKKIHDHLAEEKEFLDMFYDEARIAGLVHHPNVVSIFEFGAVGGAHFISMEYVHGQSLVELMRTAKRVSGLLPWPQVVRIVADAAGGLHAAHELRSPEGKPLNVVHRDVSPQNILVGYDGSVKVTDFGIAYAAERIAHTSTGILKGKLAYMSPEQAKAKPLDRRSDVFSLGIVLYEALCLKRLFKGDNDAATLYRLLEMKVPRPSLERMDLPKHLDEIVLKALERDPDRRFSSAGEFEAALNRVLVEEGLVITHAEVAELMDQYFHEDRLRREAQIQQALHEPVSQPIRVHIDTDQSAGSLRTRGRYPWQDVQQRRRRWRFVWLGAGGLVAVGLLVALLVFLGRGRESSRAVGAAVAPSASDARPVALVQDASAPLPRPDAGKKTVRLTVQVGPKDVKGLTIECAGQVRKGSPAEFEVPVGVPLQVVAWAPGYKREKMDLKPLKKDLALRFTLQRLPTPRRIRRVRPARPRPPRPKNDKLKPIDF